jgi:glycosyltransferase involved in cell wall biosynthesis
MRRITRKPLLRFALGRLVRRADRVGVISDDGRKLFLRHYPWAQAKLRVVPGALRHDFEDSAERERSDPADRLVVLTVARIHPRKGQLAVIEALATLPADLRERIEYRLVGTTDKEKYRRQLEATAQEAGVALRVVGEVPDALLPVQYADADLFAMTSVPYRDSVEGFGLVYLEAGALGLPVVAHDIGGVRDAVTPDETGLLVAPDDRPGLAACLRRLLEDAGLREKLGAAGRARARSHSWVENAKVLFDGL